MTALPASTWCFTKQSRLINLKKKKIRGGEVLPIIDKRGKPMNLGEKEDPKEHWINVGCRYHKEHSLRHDIQKTELF